MKIWIALVSGDGVTGPKTLARSGDPDLVRRFIAALRTNRLLEDDADDVIYDPAFPAEAERMMACLTEQTRRNAVRAFLEADPACSPAQEPAPVGPENAGPGVIGPGNTERDRVWP